jgi:serine/threonine protein kinase
MDDNLDIDAEVCPECGMPRSHAPSIGGLCPRCLIATAVEHLSTIDHPAIGRIDAGGHAPTLEQLNERLPAYEFVELLGRGGAGWVFQARQRSLDRPVAIKILRHHAGAMADAARRFEQEAQILGRLNHPRIVSVYDHGAVEDLRYIAMEYVAGPTLRDVLMAGRIDWRSAIHIGEQICETVEYAHAAGVLHRDLKPENVLFDAADTMHGLKVADFGISRLIGEGEQSSHRTQTGLVVGTPHYVAPEQALGDRSLDGRADIYSVGIMLYEMLTGQLPRGRFPRPSAVAGVPASIAAVVMRCLESDPERRFRDAASLRNALHRAATRRVLPRWAAAAAITACGALVVAALAIQLLRNDNEPTESAQQRTVASTDEPVNVAEPADVPLPAPEPISTKEEQASERPTVEPQTQTEKAQRSTPPQAPPLEAKYFELSNVQLYGVPPFSMESQGNVRKSYDDFKLREGADLVWVVATRNGHRIDMPFKMPEDASEVAVTRRVSLDIHDAWPVEIYIAERWYAPTPGDRRLSNVVRVNRGDVRHWANSPNRAFKGDHVVP